MRPVGAAAAAFLALLRVLPAQAAESDPLVPPGSDPGGVAVALIGSGIDYTRSDVAKRLARDGEGEIIGWNFVDNDRKPYSAVMDPAAAAMLGQLAGPFKIVPIKATAEKLQLGRAAVYVGQSPARIALLSIQSAAEIDWVFFKRGAQHFSDVLFIAPAGLGESCSNGAGFDLDTAPIYPAWLSLDNLLVATPALAEGGRPCPGWARGPVRIDLAVARDSPAGEGREVDGAARLAGIAAGMLQADPTLTARDLKDKIIELAKPFPDGVEPFAHHGWIALAPPAAAR